MQDLIDLVDVRLANQVSSFDATSFVMYSVSRSDAHMQLAELELADARY